MVLETSADSGGGSSSGGGECSSGGKEGQQGPEEGSLYGSDDEEDVVDAQLQEALRAMGGDQGSDPRDGGGPGRCADGGGSGGMSDSRRRRRAAVRAINAKNPRVLALLGWVVLGAFQVRVWRVSYACVSFDTCPRAPIGGTICLCGFEAP